MNKNLLWIAAPFAIVVFILTTSCGSNDSFQEQSGIRPGPKLQHIEISGVPKETELISSATDDISVNGKQFKINYKIKVLGNGKDFFSDDLELKFVLETSLLDKREKNYTEIADSKSADMLSVKITQPGLGQALSVSVCPSAVLTWNRKPNTQRSAGDTYHVYYLMHQKVAWEDAPRPDGYLYGKVAFLMESKGSIVSSGKDETETDKYFKNVTFHVTVREK